MKKLILLTLLSVAVHGYEELKIENLPQVTYQRYLKVLPYIKESSEINNIPEEMIATLLFNESGFDDNAKSWTGVTGIAQITRATAKQFNVDKSSIRSQIIGMGRVLRHHYNNLPTYFTHEKKLKMSALLFNRGKGVYWRAKRTIKSKGLFPTYRAVLNQINRYKYGKEGYVYVLRLEQNLTIFT